MTYQKPELSVLGSAEVAILGAKLVPPNFEDADTYTIGAYEVDE
jgi:hypothetical protein